MVHATAVEGAWLRLEKKSCQTRPANIHTKKLLLRDVHFFISQKAEKGIQRATNKTAAGSGSSSRHYTIGHKVRTDMLVAAVGTLRFLRAAGVIFILVHATSLIVMFDDQKLIGQTPTEDYTLYMQWRHLYSSRRCECEG